MAEIERDTRASLMRGWGRRCPACGTGAMMDGYLTVSDTCADCGTELHHHRADDGPAWATILITGHIMAPLMLLVFEMWRPEGWKMAIGFSIVFVALSLWMLPRLKGAADPGHANLPHDQEHGGERNHQPDDLGHVGCEVQLRHGKTFLSQSR